MKKIIALVLLISIPIVLKLSESSKKPLLERVEKDGYTLQPKDSLWEYAKQEFSKGHFEIKENYARKYKQPILFSLENATSKDSLAVKEVIEELKVVFPTKKVAFFSDFFKIDFETYYGNHYGSYGEEIKRYNKAEIVSMNTVLSFDKRIKHREVKETRTTISEKEKKTAEEKRNGVLTNEWASNSGKAKIIISFEDEISIEKRKDFIVSQFLETKWHLHIRDYIPHSSVKYTKELRYYKEFSKKEINKLNSEQGFLVKKLFEKDFEEQFSTYIYDTYPWRYANIFLDKEKTKQNVSAIVGFVGLLILLLSCSLFWNKKSEYSFLNYFYPMLIFAIGIYSLNSLYGYLIYIDVPKVTLLGELVTLVAICLLVLIVSFLFWKIENKMANLKPGFGYQIIIKSWLTFLFLYLPFTIVITCSFDDYVFGLKMNVYLHYLQFLFLIIGLTFARVILIYLNHFSESLVKQKDVELSRLKEINAQSELKLLQSHINPHFLYNALNSIAGLAHSNADKTEKMALSLSDLFRYSINKKGEKMSTVKEEVTMVQNYLEIEKIRFGDRLTFQLNIDETILDKNIPMYILQPLVENAIKHGVSKIGGDAKIGLEIIKDQNNLLIVVSDNGPEFPKGLVSGHGLQTVNDLLRLSYGENASLKWENTPEKKITITILKTA